VPVNPKISRVREDLSWEDVLLSSPSEIKQSGMGREGRGSERGREERERQRERERERERTSYEN